jgi:hypothetical protein
LIYRYDKCLNRLGDCGEVKLIWDCISASWVTLYVVILFI